MLSSQFAGLWCSASSYMQWVVWAADLCWQGQQDFLLRCGTVMNNLDRLMLVILRLCRLPVTFLPKRRNAGQTDLWDFHQEPAQVYPGFIVLSVPPSQNQGKLLPSSLHYCAQCLLSPCECRQAPQVGAWTAAAQGVPRGVNNKPGQTSVSLCLCFLMLCVAGGGQEWAEWTCAGSMHLHSAALALPSPVSLRALQRLHCGPTEG